MYCCTGIASLVFMSPACERIVGDGGYPSSCVGSSLF